MLCMHNTVHCPCTACALPVHCRLQQSAALLLLLSLLFAPSPQGLLGTAACVDSKAGVAGQH